ncbi:MAG: hypothetical protein K8R40_04145 [Anaerolineaceae bacterium]|nr:hypothetical protein [Anaerolineaceae bacterium]
MRKHKTLFLILISLTLFASCAANEPQVAVAEAYLEGIVSQDDINVTNFSCAEWEFDALLEMDSFLAVSPQLKDLHCAVTGSDEQSTFVNCTGAIIATYNEEQQELDLSIRTYRVIEEAGEWVVCGYQ